MEAPALERKLAAILAADVEGYSRLMHDDEDATLATLAAHRAIVDEVVTSGRGTIFATSGDGLLAEFASVADAVNAAVAIQQGLARANAALPPARRMHLRIGVNVGDVIVMEGDIFGDDVNLAARLEALAEPGGVCVTRAVRDGVRDRLDFGFTDLGERRVKNIARAVRVFRLEFDPLGELPKPAALPAAPEPAMAERGPDSEAIELAFWQSVEAGGRPAEYAAYLESYPEGAFAPLARARLATPLAALAAPAADPTVELAFWDSVKGSDDRAMLEAYLAKYPKGEFTSIAEIRLLALAGRSPVPMAPFRVRSLIRAA